MVEADAIGHLTSCHHDRDGRGHVAILFDPQLMPQPAMEWFTPAHWDGHAQPVHAGGRGSAWFVDMPSRRAVLRHYRRGGLAARASRDQYLWHGEDRTRSFAEFRLTAKLWAQGLPVARPLAASYRREGLLYRAAILIERIDGASTFAQCIDRDGSAAPWEQVGELVARFHAFGLDHADLNAHNCLFDMRGQGWLIDFDRGKLRHPATTWRHNNLSRLLRSLHKLRGTRSRATVDADFARLRAAYDARFEALS